MTFTVYSAQPCKIHFGFDNGIYGSISLLIGCTSSRLIIWGGMNWKADRRPSNTSSLASHQGTERLGGPEVGRGRTTMRCNLNLWGVLLGEQREAEPFPLSASLGSPKRTSYCPGEMMLHPHSDGTRHHRTWRSR
jgi:hypothetical protein